MTDLMTALDGLKWTLDNIYTIARLELRRMTDGHPARIDRWSHVIRLCEKAGSQERAVGVLRSGDIAQNSDLITMIKQALTDDAMVDTEDLSCDEMRTVILAALRPAVEQWMQEQGPSREWAWDAETGMAKAVTVRPLVPDSPALIVPPAPDSPQPVTAEQKARDLLGRLGMERAQELTTGDVIELANLIARDSGRSRPLDEAAERVRFEQWARPLNICWLQRADHGYLGKHAHELFSSWLAAKRDYQVRR